MVIAQNQEVEEDPSVLLPDNPFVPPKGGLCFINSLPPELLSRIFEIGAADDGSEDEDDAMDYWNNFLEENNADGKDSDVEMKDELEDEDDEDEDEEGTDDERDSDATESSDYPTSWPPFEIIVSHVCRHWRNVAFTTPSLWTTIDIGPDDRPPYECVSMLLERSKGLPIDIYVSFDPPDSECRVEHEPVDCEPPSDANLEFLYSLLVPHIHRWRTVEVSVSEYHHMYVFLKAVSDPSIAAAPQLTTLELYHHEDTDEFNNFSFPTMSKHHILFGGSAPCLTNVVLWGVHIDWNQPWIVSASKLKDLELAYHPEDVRPTWAQLTRILRGAPALEKLSLQMSGPSGDPQSWPIEPTSGCTGDLNGPAQLLKVTDLILSFHPPQRAIGLLRQLYLPALKNMVLDFDDGDYSDFIHELCGPATSLSATPQSHSLLNRLDSLKIAGLPCRLECAELLYGALKNLTSLNISMSYLPSIFLEILSGRCTLPEHGEIWLPRLLNLFVSGTTGEAVREVVQWRKDAGVPLDSLYVEESCELTKEDEEWLRKNLKTFEIFEGSDDEDIMDFEDLHEDIDEEEWSDMD